MANGYGQRTYGASGGGAVLSTNGTPRYVMGGVTINWATALVASGDVTLADGQVIPDGTRYIPFGTVIAKITASGYYGPHQVGVSDGRQTLTKGNAFCLNQTVVETDPESQYGPGAIDGGSIWQSRLKRMNDAGTAYIAHAVDATFNLTFPGFRLAEH